MAETPGPYGPSARGRLAHVLTDLSMGGCFSFAFTMANELKGTYSSLVLTETPLDQLSLPVVQFLQGAGIPVLQADRITPDVLVENGFSGAILYNLLGHPGLGRAVPSIYYSYGLYDEAAQADKVLVCSEFAKRNPRIKRFGDCTSLVPPDAQVLAPGIHTRPLRALRTPPRPYTIGIFTSGQYDKYPGDFVVQLLGRLPEDLKVLITVLPRYRHPGVELAIEDRYQRTRGKPAQLQRCTVRPNAGPGYALYCDIFCCASAPDHLEPYGRFCLEAMALGKPVVCEQRGVFTELLQHRRDSLLFSSVEEALDHITRIRRDERAVRTMTANAQLTASWQDITLQRGVLARTLRTVGM